MRYSKKIFPSFILYLFLVCKPFIGYGQFYNIKHFNTEDGLPSPEVYNMLQDSKGYMWFATDMGISRYNGYEFKNFSTENGLPDNSVFGLSEDDKGRIWIRSLSGKLAYILNDSIYTLPCNAAITKQLEYKLNTSVYVDAGDTIWLGVYGNFMLKINPGWQNKQVQKISLSENGLYFCSFNNNELIYGGNNFSGKCYITSYDKRGNKIFQLNAGIEFKNKIKQRYYALDLKDGSYLLSIDNELFLCNNKQILSRVKETATIISFTADKDKSILCCLYNGIKIYKDKSLLEHTLLNESTGKVITAVVTDRENELWYTTEGHGVYYIPFREGRYYTTEHNLPQSRISCILAQNNKVITGHLNREIRVIKKDSVAPVQLDFNKNYVNGNDRVTCFYSPQQNELYIGKHLNIYKLNPDDTKNCTVYKTGGAKKIIKSPDSNIWILRNTHLTKLNVKNNFSVMEDISFGNFTDDIYESKNAVVWLCTNKGLYAYKNGSIISPEKMNPLLSSRIVNITEDKNGDLWMASRGEGVLVKRGDTVVQIKKENGLASNMCRDIFIDHNNTIWVGSNNGLSKITLRAKEPFTYKVDVFTEKNGLLSNEVNHIIEYNSELWLTHNDAISVLNPSALKNNLAPPPVYVVNTTINNKTYKENSLRLDYSKNYLSISYIGLSYKMPGSIEYKYKMEGLDTSWIYTKYTSAQFQTLSPGTYKFIVYAKNNDGYWSNKPAELSLVVLPAWWQTWVFYILVFTSLTGLIYLLVKKRIDLVQQRRHEKSEFKTKIATNELKALRAQMNPHFIFNAINSVQHFITSNDPVASQKHLSKFAKLIRYVVDNSKPGTIPIEKELEAIKIFLDLEALRFENRFEYFIHVDNKIDTAFVQIPSMLIQPYIENAIWHGIMPKDGKGKIEVSIELLENTLKCIVEDNGIGRKKSKEFQAQQKFKTHKSIGMSNTRERLEIINQLNNSALSVQIIDLLDKEGNALGTRVELFIPFY